MVDLKNLRMQEKLLNGEAVDVKECDRTADRDYILAEFLEGVDYCDSGVEAWIWSIGVEHKTGRIVASTSAKFYQNLEYKCLWLR